MECGLQISSIEGRTREFLEVYDTNIGIRSVLATATEYVSVAASARQGAALWSPNPPTPNCMRRARHVSFGRMAYVTQDTLSSAVPRRASIPSRAVRRLCPLPTFACAGLRTTNCTTFERLNHRLHLRHTVPDGELCGPTPMQVWSGLRAVVYLVKVRRQDDDIRSMTGHLQIAHEGVTFVVNAKAVRD